MQPAMVPESLLEERRALGHDRFDEVWDGVLHMVPFPTTHHARVERDLLIALHPIAARRGLHVFAHVGIYEPGVPGHRNYRGPDLVIVERRHVSERGIEGNAHLVVEILPPDDESRAKLPFYAAIGVREVWLLDPRARHLEMLALHGSAYRLVALERGVLQSPALAIDVSIDGATLRLRDADEVAALALDAF